MHLDFVCDCVMYVFSCPEHALHSDRSFAISTICMPTSRKSLHWICACTWMLCLCLYTCDLYDICYFLSSHFCVCPLVNVPLFNRV